MTKDAIKFQIEEQLTVCAGGERGHFWPSVCRLADGRLLCVWSGDRRNHLCPFGKVMGAYSADEGRSWSAPKVLFETPLDDRDAGAVQWGNKTVLTTFNNSLSAQRAWIHAKGRVEGEAEAIERYLDTVTQEDEKTWLGSLILVSEDGEHFHSPVKLPVTTPHGPIPLKDGRLFYIGREFLSDPATPPAEYRGYLRAYWTKDLLHWEAKDLPAPPEGFVQHEPYAIEDGDRILIATRAHWPDESMTTHLAVYENGEFSPWETTDWHGGPPHLLRVKGRIVLTYGRREPPYGIRARVLCGENWFEDWSEELILRDDAWNFDLGYPCSVELKDGSILTVYYNRKPGMRLPSIEGTRWRLEEV